ncbi:protein jagged-1-like [Ostrea edulis]|uniref:protein jagged-1-like n=1 Tax=Ostrea edulis TaxID=37623 RepID=UPI0024AEC691|nr:protein jagged-1-like [Ostrea edulis]
MHGTCVDLVNAYRCLCQPGYSGTNCEIEVNECQSSPCVHGQCVDEINAFKCECDFGYFGSFCSEFNYQLLWILLSCLPIFMVILFIAKRAKIDKLKEDEFNIFVFPEVVRGESKPKWRSTERNECVHT